MRIAINGFGRIGRAAFKIAMDRDDMEVVALNDLAPNETLAHLLKYDTVYGKYPHVVSSDEKSITVDGKQVPVFELKDPKTLPWKDLRVDVVLESTGKFRKADEADDHLEAGARAVIISAPAKGDGAPTYVIGVNDNLCTGKKLVMSNASCTTNCIAPPVDVIHKTFGIKKAMMTTIHAYTADQNLIDSQHKDLRRARSAAANIIPTTTGAAKATTEVIPDLKGKFDGVAMRVPVAVGSLSDITMLLARSATKEEINAVLKEAAAGPLKGIMETTEDPIVSSDIIGNAHSAIVDLSLTQVVDGDLVKVVAWYDNEWGYAHRLIELAAKVGVCLNAQNS